VALGYDGRGNLTQSGTASHTYTSENRLSGSMGVYLFRYENTGHRIMQIYDYSTARDQRFVWSGDQMISEVSMPSWTIALRHLFGPGDDSPLVWYEGSGTTDKRSLIPDERGSIIAVTNASGAVTNVNRYDDYGVPASANAGRFQNTGQAGRLQLRGVFVDTRGCPVLCRGPTQFSNEFPRL
jgi:hypothetical protein